MSKIIVGISGGVDSSVAAYLLKKAGHEVIGCRMRTFDTKASEKEEEESRKVCEALSIPLHIYDFREEFKKEVIELFAKEYSEGRTPNPCCICNRTVKWQALERCRNDFSADAVATGHYARTEYLNGRWSVGRAGSGKDQSYALYNLSQEEIRDTLFPLASYEKEEIRAIAKEAGLLTAEKPDSMEICFIPENDYAGFLKENFGIEDRPGNYVDEKGTVLGRHEGIVHYTVGQRKGLGIALGKRIFVKEIRPLTNEVVLADDADVFTGSILIKDVNFQAAGPDQEIVSACLIKVRYADKGTPGTVTRESENRYRINFATPVRAAAPGQAAVLYDEAGRILLGGTIVL